MQAKFIRGNPEFARYKPGSAVSAGDVIVIGDLVVIAHSDIAAGIWGNVAVGGGIYEVTCQLAIAVGLEVYWDDAADKIDLTNTNKMFGYMNLHKAASADTDVREALHRPH